MTSKRLSDAKNVKNDEFYTQYVDIQKEINAYLEFDPNIFRDKIVLLPCDDPEWSNFTKFFAQSFERLGIKKLISTSYALESKKFKFPTQLTLFETESPKFDTNITKTHGKKFTLTRDKNNNNKIDLEDLEWEYLKGDGDFRSDEVKSLRAEADIIITNPPFSIYREFISWLFEEDKKFLIIGNKNSITYKEIFLLIKENKMWIGSRNINQDIWFIVPEGQAYEKVVNGEKLKHIMGCWFTNIDHGRRHQPLQLMTMADNIIYSKHKEIRDFGYIRYDNYNAIEVPFVDSIPSDYEGIMGVPITFLGNHNPDQYEILGETQRGCHDDVPDFKKYDDYWEVNRKGEKTGSSGSKTNENANIKRNDGKHNFFTNSEGIEIQSTYQRIFIKKRCHNED